MRSGRAWSRPRAPAPRTTTTAASLASVRSSDAYERSGSFCPRARGGVSVAEQVAKGTIDREQRVLRIIETARAKRPRFRDERITMAHGAGGRATNTLIEGLLV